MIYSHPIIPQPPLKHNRLNGSKTNNDSCLTRGKNCDIYSGAKTIYEEDNMFMKSLNAVTSRNKGITGWLGIISIIISIHLLGRIWGLIEINTGECPLLLSGTRSGH